MKTLKEIRADFMRKIDTGERLPPVTIAIFFEMAMDSVEELLAELPGEDHLPPQYIEGVASNQYNKRGYEIRKRIAAVKGDETKCR